jgi:penicillin amidase
VLHERNGASERLVLSPNHPEAASLQMPGGQSGHPLSPHYRDQQADWADGQMSAFLPGPTQHQLHLLPP